MKHLVTAIIGLLLISTAFAQEDKCIALLKSNASTQEKAAACRELAQVGTGQAVPVLTTLLGDEMLSHMARYALEPIADPSVDAALRSALGTLKGYQLVGVIVSIGVRKDVQAIEPLAQCLRHANPAVAEAAAQSLGSIGGPAVQVLGNALSRMSDRTQTYQRAICEGLFRCAEAMPDDQASVLYDRVRTVSNLPYQVHVAAVRGAILSRGAGGVSLWRDILRDEPSMAADLMGISLAIPSQAMTRAMVRELAQANPQTKLRLVQTLGLRGDVTATPALTPLAHTGPVNLRIAAIVSLVQLGSPPSIPVLLELVKDSDPAASSAARTGLIGFPGSEVDTAVVAWLNEPDTTDRMAAIDVAGQRRITAAVQPLLQATGDSRAEVVHTSFKTLGELADAAQIPDMVDAMLKTGAVAPAEAALSAICARQPDTAMCTDKLLPGLHRAQGRPKLALLRVLRTVGDAKALAAVRAAAAESDQTVAETATRVLCDWPTVEALPDLAKLASTTANPTFRILALRGQLRLIPVQIEADALKLSQLKTVLAQIQRPEEQRLALALLGQLPSAESLTIVMSILAQDALNDEASVTAVGIAEHIAATHPAEVASAMKQVRTSNKALTQRIQQVLARIQEPTDDGFMSLFNGKDLTGWDGKPGWWTVEDGALTAESTPDRPCKVCNYLVWRDGQPGDFELLADFKLSGSGNSGIQIRSEIRPAWDTYGYQADMTGDGELIGFVYHHKYALIAGRGTKAIFQADGTQTVEQVSDPAALLTHYRQDDWNTYRVVCLGPDITLYINGVLMCQITDHRVPEAARRGIIALQMHPGPPMKIQFKNLRLKALK
ncbi:MAG: DUF1080 domain-containing protein [Phycisphaerae bacterium]|nr:DUF1080 domain-containing protein [Phycisphaerae bacterium]